MGNQWDRLIALLLLKPSKRPMIYEWYNSQTESAPEQHLWVMEKMAELSFLNIQWDEADFIEYCNLESGSTKKSLIDFLRNCRVSLKPSDTPELIFNLISGNQSSLPPYVYTGERARLLADSPPPDSVVGGLLHRGHVTVLSAPPYSGKSWFALNIASAVASVSIQRPAPWPGAVLDCPGTGVCYVSPDFPVSELARRLRKLDQMRTDLVLADSYWDNIYLVGDAPGITMPRDRYGLTEDGINRLINEVVPENASLVILDTLSASLPPEVTENDNAGMARTMGQVQRIASERDVAVLLIHHTAKPTAGKGSSEVWSSVRGAGAISGSASSNCLIEQLPNDDWPNIRRLRTVSNVCSGLPTTFFEVRPAYLKTDEILYFRPVPDPETFENEND